MKDSDSIEQRYVVFRSFVEVHEQKELVREALGCHAQNSSSNNTTTTDWTTLETSTTSLNLQLGIPCGGDLTSTLPAAIAVARRAFHRAQQHEQQQQQLLPPDPSVQAALQTLSDPSTRLAGLALLYGPAASMLAHYDSPTQPGVPFEWLVVMTLGRAVRFRCNHNILTLQSGDVLVMDSMAVLHGVESIGDDCDADLGLPVSSRLGILFWQGRSSSLAMQSGEGATNEAVEVVDGVGSLFPDSDSD